MKEIKLLDRVQAVSHFYITNILATIQEGALKSEPASNYFCNLLLQLELNVFKKNVIF